MYHLVDVQSRQLLYILVGPRNRIDFDLGRHLDLVHFEECFHVKISLSDVLHVVLYKLWRHHLGRLLRMAGLRILIEGAMSGC